MLVQRGNSDNARGYGRDLHTVREPLPRTVVDRICDILTQNGRAGLATQFSTTATPRLWGGPKGIRSVFNRLSENDVCLFIENRKFVFAARTALKFEDLDANTTSAISELVWQRSDYPYIWAMDIGFPASEWAGDVGATLLGNDGYFINQRSGNLSYFSDINVNHIKPDVLESMGGAKRLLGEVGLTPQEVLALS